MNKDNDLKNSFETLVVGTYLWDEVCRELNSEWESAILNLNSDVENEIHEQDFAWLVCRGKYPFEFPTSFNTRKGQTIAMRVIVLRENERIIKVHGIPCVNVEFFKM